MTKIKAPCPKCGPVHLTEQDIVLRVGITLDLSTYGFTCPGCGGFVCNPADGRVVHLLVSGGVTPVLAHIPAEVFEHRDGPPLTSDDLLDFHELLQGDEWQKELSR